MGCRLLVKDEEIIREVQRGQTKLFEELVRKYYEKIYRYCYYHISNEHSALDITQEVFMKIYENIEIYENKGKFQNYLYVIAGNACKDYFKKKKIYSLEEVPEFGNENTILETENKILVQQALKSLTMEEREIIILRYYQDLKYKDISQITGASISRLEYYLNKSIKKLREYMDRE